MWVACWIIEITTYFSILDDKISVEGEILGCALARQLWTTGGRHSKKLYMAANRLIKRYSAYYSGWCVAFGEHKAVYDESRDINWLHGESQVGFALAPKLKKILVRELLSKHVDIPEITLTDSYVKINDKCYDFRTEEDAREMQALKSFFETPDDIHMFLTSHFCYPPGTQIITFATKSPLVIMYKEIKPLKLTVI